MDSSIWVAQGTLKLSLEGLSIVDFRPREGRKPPKLNLAWRNGNIGTFYGAEALSLYRTVTTLYPHLKQ